MKATSLVTLVVLSNLTVRAHDWHRHEDPQFANLQPLTLTELAIIAEEQLALQEFAAAVPVQFALAAAPATQTKTTATQPAAVRAFVASFTPFAPKVKTRWDERFFYVESDGLPAHTMMVGITAWQQQVPLPQPYVGENAWRIPLHPVVSKSPVSIRGRFLRGAIALAANGIPIFNPQNNRGEVSQEIGELDQWGGHCGRADDYHYHAAPLHLQEMLGKTLPIAFALDGYPIYGLAEPDGSAPANLDAFNGHETAKLGYHYHGSTKYPYVNGGFHGEVVEVGGQVDPQPRAQPVRPDLPPLRGAKITGFTAKSEKSYSLKYEVGAETRYVNYTLNNDQSVKFDFVDGRGEVRTENYTPLQRGPGGGPGDPRQDGDGQGRPRPGPQREGGRPGDRADARSARGDAGSGAAPFILNVKRSGTFVLHSSVVADGGALPVEFTGDGAGVAPPIEWTGVPAGTRSFAVVMDHLAPGNEMKCYWTMWDVPANVTSLPKDARTIGKLGPGFKGALGYEPPHSQGPGLKTYAIHIYALSEAPQFSQPQREVTREVLLAAIKDSVLDSAELKVTYTRPGIDTPGDQRPPRRVENSDAQVRPQLAAQSPGNEQTPQRPADRRPGPGGGLGGGGDNRRLIKPTMADTMKVNVYADNWFVMYINGKLRAVDSIEFTPHNVVTVDLLPEYPMTIAIMAKDNADPKTGLEYGDHIGDGGFIVKFADGTVSDAKWKAKNFFKGPLNGDAKNPKVEHTPIPTNWFAVNFDDSQWSHAVEYTEERVNPKEPFHNADFKGAKFIWTSDLDLDNTVIFRTRVEKPGWQPRWNTKPDLDVSGAPFR